MIENKIIGIIWAVLATILIVYAANIKTEDAEIEISQPTSEIFELTSEITEETSETIEQTTQIESFVIYNIPLSEDLQIYTQEVCREYKVPVDMVIAVMYVESRFNQEARNGNCYGLMQVNAINAEELKSIGVYDLTDAKQNIKSGVYLLSKALTKFDLSGALIAYNCGESGAREKLNNGITSTDYTRKVLKYAANLKVKEYVYTSIDTQ